MDFAKLIEQLKKAAQELIDANKDKFPKNTPSEPTTPTTPNSGEPSGNYIQSDKILGLMATDLLCDPALENRQADLLRLRTKYNTILSLLDLQKNGAKQTRPYVEWARTRTELTPLGEKNIKFLHSLGFKVHVILLNSWGAKHGFCQQMGSTQESLPNEAALYSQKQLDRELSFIQDLLSKVGDKIDGIMPLLEAVQKGAASFGMKMAESIRAQGFKGKIVFNHISDARSELNKHNYKGYGVLIASSLNDATAWRNSTNDIKNTDGMQELTENRTDLIGEFTKSGGPFGFYLWASNLIGNKDGRTQYSENWVKYANTHVYANVQTNIPIITTPSERPVPTNESPEARHKRLYPHVKLTGGNHGTATNKTLWKPVADSSKRLVIVTSHDLPKITSISLERSGSVIEKKDISSVQTAGNGYRLNFHFSKQGSGFGKGITLRIKTVEGDYTGEIPDGGKRYDPVNLKRASVIKPQEPIATEPQPMNNDGWLYPGFYLYQYSDGRLKVHPKLVPWLNSKPRGVQWVYKIEAWSWPNFQAESTTKIGDGLYKTQKPLNQYPYGKIKWRSWRLELDPAKAAEYHRVYLSLGLPRFKHVNDNGTRDVDVNYTGPIKLEIQ